MWPPSFYVVRGFGLRVSDIGQATTSTRGPLRYPSSMKMTPEHKAIDKIYKRRDRYEIPDWQRDKVWKRPAKQQLIDSILRGWKLPKFYFIKTAPDSYLVEDGQQRLNAIYEFFSNELPLSDESAALFGARLYRDLKGHLPDEFDDFEIDFDVIEGATDEELKEFFQRLQAGAPLNTSEKLNAVHSNLRDFCKDKAKDKFFTEKIALPDTRFAHFDIVAKVMAIEVEGLDVGLRLEDVKEVFEHQANFSKTSATAKRLDSALAILKTAFPSQEKTLKTRTAVQSLLTLTCRMAATGKMKGKEAELRHFITQFYAELSRQVELGQAASDSDYLSFQSSVNANVRAGVRLREEILLRKLFRLAPSLAAIFDPSVIAEAAISSRVKAVGESISTLISQINEKYAAVHGLDLFKPTNKTVQAQNRLRQQISDLAGYKALLDDLYFLLWEGPGTRLESNWPPSFLHVRDLRTDLQHDVDHGDASKVRSKRKKFGETFTGYGGLGSPSTMEPALLAVVQANLLGAIEGDLKAMLRSI